MTRRCAPRGFSLTELMLVLALIALVTAIAIPVYRNYAVDAKRSDGRSALLDAASRMERYKFDTGHYRLTTAQEKALIEGKSPEGLYAVTYAAVDNGRGYSLTATPTHTDSACATLTLDHFGRKGPSADCW